MKDKSYRAFPIGLEAGHYLRAKRKRLTAESYRDYEACLDKLARYFADLELSDLEPPIGTERLEEFLEFQWGATGGADVQQEPLNPPRLLRLPRPPREPAGRPDADHRTGEDSAAFTATTFTPDDRNGDPRLEPRRSATSSRSGSCSTTDSARARCRGIQFKHFDHYRKRLTVFTKGGKIRDLPIPHPGFWNDLGQLIVEDQAQPRHYLLSRRKAIPRPEAARHGRRTSSGTSRWVSTASTTGGTAACSGPGSFAAGVTSGERMHKARHTAGQRVLDATGNLKAVQKLLGHESIQTTGDIYTDWDVEQLAESLLEAVQDDEDLESFPSEHPGEPAWLSQKWRRRESNPRPRSYRTNVYERSPRLDLARRPEADALPAGQPILWVSSLRRLALLRLLARSLAPRAPASGRTGMGRRLT